MFIAIPHSTDLHLGARPYVTFTVCLLCLAVHLANFNIELVVYHPDTWNPVMMLVASLAHADWFHLIGNLIFFCAFSPALEIIVGNRLRYIGFLLALAVLTHITYSVYTLISGQPVPTLGLSGVVMGVIGLSAYLMPKVHIRVFVWFLFYVRNIYLPAWLLAIWYIGWDSWDLYEFGNSTGINLVSHVSGGVAGYLIGYFRFKECREDIKDELDDAIDYARSQRQDHGMASSYSGGRQKMQEELRVREANRDHEQYMSRLYQYVQADRDSDAIMLFLEDYELQSLSVEIYEELFERMHQWGPGRALLCLGRLCVYLRMEKRDYKRAMEIVEKCQTISEDFVLVDSSQALLLAWRAIDMSLHQNAYLLVQNAESRYGNSADIIKCKLLEVELLWMHLDETDKARSLVKELLLRKYDEYREEILALAGRIQ